MKADHDTGCKASEKDELRTLQKSYTKSPKASKMS